ncbi:MAG: site-specific integrase [Bacteriovoracaceae bacterium]|nr:site-specific integrase [Bacteriovoracaceae bacterium]
MEKVKLKNGELRYRESYYIGGKKINSPSFKKITDAKIWKNRVETERLSKLALGEHYHKTVEVNFEQFADKWLHNHVEVNCVHKTFLSYGSILRTHLYPRFAKLNLSDITEEMGMDLMKDLRKTHTAKGIKNIWIVFRSIIHKARRDKIIVVDPLENIKKPKPDLVQDNFWIKVEINQFLRANKTDQLLPFFFVAIHTGLRLAEMCGLKWDRIDFVNNQISVTRTRDKYGLKETTKTKIKRFVPMTQEVRMLLVSLRQSSNGNPFVFLEADGSEVKYAHIYRRFHKAQDKAGITNKIRFHDLRHSFASNYMMNGGNVFDLQKLLGHTDIKMTMRYAHFTPDHLQNSIQFMDMTSESKMSIPFIDQRKLNVVD